jgi:CSLREA domain-containing protein
MTPRLSKSVAAVVSIAGSLVFASAASAATITPDNGADDGTGCTLREAIQSANTDADFGGCTHTGSYTAGGADTIQLAASTTYNIGFNDPPDYGEDANVKGDFDINAGAGLTIQGAGTGGTRSKIEGNQVDRIFHILPASTGPVTISNVILDQGRADHVSGEKGGAILNEGGNLTVTGSDLTGNLSAAGGAGIETTGSSTTQITDSSIIDSNQCCDATTTGGGGIDVSSGGGGSLTITNSQIGAPGHANLAQSGAATPARGGGISFAPATSATLNVTDSRIVNNTTFSNGGGSEGGGVFVGGATGSTVNFTRVLIDGNFTNPITTTDSALGAGVYLDGPAVTFTDSLIQNNQGGAHGLATNSGGGVFVNSSPAGGIRLVGTTVAGNSLINQDVTSSVRSGGGIFNRGTLVLLNSTIDGNNAGSGSGGGLTEAAGTASIFNSTFAGNSATNGASYRQLGGSASIRGSITDSGNNGCLGNITSNGFNIGSDSSCGLTDGTDIENGNAALGGLQDNGGPAAGGTTGGAAVPVPTEDPNFTSSDAIDHIPAASCTNDASNPLTVDQRGVPRPLDGNGDNVDACDSGAVEVAQCDGLEATLVGTNGPDTITGSGLDNVIVGAAGNDTIDGGAGNDTICGGPGNDTITGGAGVDDLLGGPGANTIFAQDGVADNIDCTGGGPNSGTVDTSPAEHYIGCDSDADGVVDFLDACPTQAGTNGGCPLVTTPPPTNNTPAPPPTGPTGQRDAALKKCKKKKTATARKKCKANANKLPV